PQASQRYQACPSSPVRQRWSWSIAVPPRRHVPHDPRPLGTPRPHRSGHGRREIAGKPALWYLTSAPEAGYRAEVRTMPR
ncbi:MAG: hypothetical protein KJ000_36370, partial [Pirellulaceae bacterium]|nr:hypothetical protein [Pirellulaceae bacterium]